MTPNRLAQDLQTRLACGEHLVLRGPRGAGKSRLAADLQRHFESAHQPCGMATATDCLNSLTEAFLRAYPGVTTAGLARRHARSRLYLTAEHRRGILLLDHVTEVSKAMVGFLRRLRGGVMGVLLIVDVDDARELQALRGWHIGSLSVRMPRYATREMRQLLKSECATHAVELDARTRSYLLRMARGRPGWVIRCAQLAASADYRREEGFLAHLLAFETEWVVRANLASRPQRSSREAGARATRATPATKDVRELVAASILRRRS